MVSPFFAEAAPPTGTVTYLFTDIEGSTPLWDSRPTEMGQALAGHDQILAEAFRANGGYVFSVAGDGYGAAFATATAAFDAAITIQRLLRAEPRIGEIQLSVRMGLHTGEAEERDGNYFGTAVNQAARIMSAANGQQILLSAVTAEPLAGRSGIGLIDLGSFTLTGLVEPVQLFGVSTADYAWPDLPLRVDRPLTGNLPVVSSDYVGDIEQLRRVVDELSADGIVTITGPGGIGKTRAAIEIGHHRRDDFVDGIWLAELATVTDPDDAVDAVASILAVQPQPGLTTGEAIVDWCVGRTMLLILDNCEHVAGPIAGLASALMACCPTVTVLATSQEPLRVPGENVLNLPALRSEEAATLFVNRARAHDNRFDPSPSDRESIDDICRRLDGIPLAVELAAARTRSMAPLEIAQRLDDRFRLLRSTDRQPVERHRTLWTTVDWSYRLLSDEARDLFDRLAVFVGSFDLGAVVAVLELDDYRALDLLAELVDKSMVVADMSTGSTRYRMLETIRQYGLEQLAARGELDELRNRHLRHFTDRSIDLHDRWLGTDQARADIGFDLEWDNLRTAHRWALSTRRPDEAQTIVFATAWHAMERLRNEHRQWTADALELGVELEATRSTTYSVAAGWAYFAAEPERTIEMAREGLLRHPDDPYVGGCLAWMIYGLLGADRPEEIEALVPAIASELEHDRPIDAEFMMQMALTTALLLDPSDEQEQRFTDFCRRLSSPMALARAALLRGERRASIDPPDLDGAIVAYQEGIRLGETHAPSEYVWSLNGLATCLAARDDDQAAPALRDAIARSYDVRLWFGLDLALGTCAAHLLTRSPQVAAVIIGHLSMRAPSAVGATTRARRQSMAAVEAMDNGEQWMAQGRAMNRHEIVAYALDALADV
ncbi:MAG: adenylate/guanylate cyclase domain-containing protein [Acidimicrobiia bacterium]|nr:adenylate/guanylate cyclase domain-containing protein [Acidimicrobiia bacterium]